MVVQHGCRTLSPGFLSILRAQIISARASRSKVETRRQLFHRIPKNLRPAGAVGGPCFAGEVIASVVVKFDARQGIEWRWQTWAIANNSMSTMSMLFSLSHGSL